MGLKRNVSRPVVCLFVLAIVVTGFPLTGCQTFRERIWFPGKEKPSTREELPDPPFYTGDVYENDSAQIDAYRKNAARQEEIEKKDSDKKPWYKNFYFSDRGREIDARFGD